MLIDMHMHTNCSDGSLCISEIVELALKRGLTLIALTDHDTISGIENAICYCADKIKLISGIEFTCRESDFGVCKESGKRIKASIHMLGYGIHIHNEELCHYLDARQEAFENFYKKTIQGLAHFHMQFCYQDVRISCGNLMQICDIKQYIQTVFANHKNLQQAKDYIDSRIPILNEIQTPISEAVRLIQGAGGKAVWAHPFVMYQKGEKHTINEREVLQMLDTLKKFGVNGIEAFYQDFSLEQREFLYAQALKNKMMATVGSDFHNMEQRDNMVNFLVPLSVMESIYPLL